MGFMGPLVLFDGVCNFCNGSVNFIIKRDPRAIFRFAALQSEAGRKMLEECGVSPDGIESVVLIEDGRLFEASTASLRIAKRLGAPWSWTYALILIPKFVRDGLYKLFARNRYRLFGQKDACMMPTAEVRARFLD